MAQEYLAAAYSLKPDNDPSLASAELRDDVRAARAELLRIAIGEMRHISRPWSRLRALLAVLLLSLTLLVGCVDEARRSSPNHGLGRTAPAPCTDSSTSAGQHDRDTCAPHNGVREWLRSIRP